MGYIIGMKSYDDRCIYSLPIAPALFERLSRAVLSLLSRKKSFPAIHAMDDPSNEFPFLSVSPISLRQGTTQPRESHGLLPLARFFHAEKGRRSWFKLQKNYWEDFSSLADYCREGDLGNAIDFLVSRELATEEDFAPQLHPERFGESSWVNSIQMMGRSWNDLHQYAAMDGDYRDELSFFFDRINGTLVRCAVATMDGRAQSEILNDLAWHRDESVFQHLRLVIPIQSSPEFRIQVDGADSQYLAPGRMYFWNTERLHRMIIEKKCDFQRVHLIIGITPWEDYNPRTNEWMENSFSEKLHPFELLLKRKIVDF